MFYKELDPIVLYIPECNQLVSIKEGSGDNLSKEDREEGFVPEGKVRLEAEEAPDPEAAPEGMGYVPGWAATVRKEGLESKDLWYSFLSVQPWLSASVCCFA